MPCCHVDIASLLRASYMRYMPLLFAIYAMLYAAIFRYGAMRCEIFRRAADARCA